MTLRADPRIRSAHTIRHAAVFVTATLGLATATHSSQDHTRDTGSCLARTFPLGVTQKTAVRPRVS